MSMLTEKVIRHRLIVVQKELNSKLEAKPKDSAFPNMNSTDIIVLEVEKDVLEWVLRIPEE